MIYCYRCENCDAVHEEEYSPKGHIPEKINCFQCDGEAYRSYADEGGKVADAAIAASNKYPYTSQRLPRNLEGCPHNSKGQPVILSKRHEREVMAKHGYRRD